jgi:zinc protease
MSRGMPPLLRPPVDARMPPIRTERLSSGMAVHVLELHHLPVVDLRVVFRAGAATDDPALAGRAYLTADLLDEGTTSRTAGEIADEAERLGASLYTRASWDFCAAELHVLSPRLKPALDLLADITLHPTFAGEELDRKRAERLSSIMQEQADPRTLASQAFAQVLYGEAHPFGTAIGGTRQSVERITRQDIADFHSQRFQTADTFIVAVGDVHVQQLMSWLDDLFGNWPGTAAAAAALPDPPPRQPAIHVVHRPGASQSEIRIGHAGPSRHSPDYFTLHVANTVLGGAFSSRLNMLLREEKAYTYGAGSSFAFRAGGGPFFASTAVFTDVTPDAVGSIVDEIGRMSAERVTEAELERAKSYITLGLPRTFETTGDMAEHASEAALYELGTDYHDRYAAAIRGVSAEDVLVSAGRWMRRADLNVVIVGDAERIAADLEGLELGAVHVREGG